MIACVAVSLLPIAVAYRATPALARRPLVLIRPNQQNPAIIAACPTAQRYGIQSGMRLRQAVLRCPQIQWRPAAPDADEQALRGLVAYLATVSPRWEVVSTTPDAEVLLALGRWHPDTALSWAQQLAAESPRQSGLPVVVGIAPTSTLARLAARQAQLGQPRVVAPAAVDALLAGCSIDLLPELALWKPRLRQLGFRTLADVAALPAEAIAVQFGSAALAIWRQLHGQTRPLACTPILPCLQQRRAFAGIVADRQVLVQVLNQLAHALAAALQHQGLQARTLVLTLDHDDATATTLTRVLLPPSAEGRLLAQALTGLLNRTRIRYGVTEIAVSSSGVVPLQPTQLTLWPTPTGQRDRLDALAHDLNAGPYAGTLLRLVAVNPRALLPEERTQLRRWEET